MPAFDPATDLAHTGTAEQRRQSRRLILLISFLNAVVLLSAFRFLNVNESLQWLWFSGPFWVNVLLLYRWNKHYRNLEDNGWVQLSLVVNGMVTLMGAASPLLSYLTFGYLKLGYFLNTGWYFPIMQIWLLPVLIALLLFAKPILMWWYDAIKYWYYSICLALKINPDELSDSQLVARIQARPSSAVRSITILLIIGVSIWIEHAIGFEKLVSQLAAYFKRIPGHGTSGHATSFPTLGQIYSFFYVGAILLLLYWLSHQRRVYSHGPVHYATLTSPVVDYQAAYPQRSSLYRWLRGDLPLRAAFFEFYVFLPILISILLGMLLFTIDLKTSLKLGAKSIFVAMAFSWFVMSLIGLYGVYRGMRNAPNMVWQIMTVVVALALETSMLARMVRFV